MIAMYGLGTRQGAMLPALVPSDNLYIGAKAMKAALGGLTTLEEDILTIAGSVYATDLGVKRGSLTRAVRTIHLSIEVTNVAALKPHVKHIEHCLYFLSNDNWNITLVPKNGVPEATFKIGQHVTEWSSCFRAV